MGTSYLSCHLRRALHGRLWQEDLSSKAKESPKVDAVAGKRVVETT
jgi:hypothetical protein